MIYSDEKQPYRTLDATIRSGLYDKRYRICFSSLLVQNAFYKLLENPCAKCDNRNFVSFELLKKHVSREHQMFYCDLCTDNLKIFPFERRCYNRTDLALHNRKGDVDDKSHRGHPLCEYCDVRYLDRDELFRHLRREHYFCHFCDADGSNQFYEDYPSLRDHFHREHFVCDEGACVDEQFTGVFRTEIDLKVHQAKTHSSTLGKMAQKQARTLELEFSLVPRNRAGNGPGGGNTSSNDRQQRGGNNNNNNNSSRDNHNNPYMNVEPGPSQIDLNPRQAPKRVIDSNNEQEFPSLGGGGGATGGPSSSNARQDATMRSKAFKGQGNLTRTKENFPALGGGGAAASNSAGPAMGGNYKKVSASAMLKAKPAASSSTSAPSTSASKPGTVIHISNRPKEFPALGRGARSNHHHSSAAMDEDDQTVPVSQMMSQLHVNNHAISHKHRGLVDEYSIASAVAQKQGPKVGLVKAAPVAPPSPARQQAPVKMKLKSEENFPSLSAGPSCGPAGAWSASAAPKWVSKQPATNTNANKVESRKSKVAPNPMSNNSDSGKQKEKNKQQQQKGNGKGDGKQNNGGGSSLVANGLILGQKGPSASGNGAWGNTKAGSSNTAGSSSSTAPPGFGAKPPNNNKSTAAGSSNPPPGFNVTLNSVNRNNVAANGTLTFTNSTGEKYKIVPTRRYISPPGIQKRNQELVNIFRQTLTEPEAMNEFKIISQMFRENAYSAVPYYDHCKAALGERFNEVFPELLALLPDIGKQQVNIILLLFSMPWKILIILFI